MKHKGFKLLMGSVATAAAAVTFTATTFAFVAISNNVYVKDLDFNITGYEGLMISLDGENYSQDISSKTLKKHIAGSEEDYSKIYLQGCTLSDGVSSVINYTSETVKVRGEETSVKYAKFKYDTVDTVARTHKLADAEANTDYIQFNLWFKALNSANETDEYELRFNESTSITADDEEIEIFNNFVADRSYKAGDKVTQNLANAMRLGIYSDSMKIFEVTDDKDMGSAAIEGATDDKHRPANNVMYQYYNVLFPFYPFTKAAKDGDAFKTETSWGEVKNGTYIGESVADIKIENGAQQAEKMITVYLWLEGWDSDYIPGTSKTASAIKVNLGFELAAKPKQTPQPQQPTDPQTTQPADPQQP